MFKRIKNQLTGKSEPPAPPSAPKVPSPAAGQPHPQHYNYAHRILPSMIFHDPELILKIVGSPKGLEFLRMQWSKLDQHVAVPESSVGLDYETRRLPDDTTLIIFTMPPPANVTEAYYTAAVYRPQSGDKPAVLRYFTLEYGMDIIPSEIKRTVLGEWTTTHQHFNYGDHHISDIAGFFKAVCDKLDQSTGSGAQGSIKLPSQ